MSDSKQRDIQTAYGETSIETVECASCEMEVPKSNAKQFVIGDPTIREKRNRNRVEYRFRPRPDASGWACERCLDEGVLAFPAGSLHEFIASSVFPFLVGAVLSCLVVAMVVGAGP